MSPNESGGPFLRARGVEVTFRARGPIGRKGGLVRAVRGVDLDVHAGRTLAIVGESGSGKSTLARTFLGLQRPTAGTIEYFGRDIRSLRGRDRSAFRTAVQVVFQDPGASLNPRKSVGRILGEVLLLHGKATRRTLGEKIDELLHSVGLDPGMFRARRPSQMSGGQKQRVAIARALAVEPTMIVADEALSALDVSVQARVLELMERVQRNTGIGFLFITHDLGVAEEIADDVAVMYLGQVVEYGSASEVLNHPRHPYTRALLDSRLLPDPHTRRPIGVGVLRGDLPSPVDVPGGCPVHPRCVFATDTCRAVVPDPVTPRTMLVGERLVSDHASSCMRADELAADLGDVPASEPLSAR